MEEGKIATWAQFGATERIHQYIMRVLPWVTLLLAWGRLGSISAPFGEPASRFLVQLNVRNMEEGKIATLGQFGATERSPSMYIRSVLPWSNTFVRWGRLGSISAPFGEPASRFTSAIERSEYGRR
jgi:hypothetical protein